MEIAQEMINTFIQLFIFSLIPLIWWFFKGRKHINFFKWIGLYKPSIKNHRGFIGVIIADITIILHQFFIVIPIFIDKSDLATSSFANRGLGALFIALQKLKLLLVHPN